MASISLFDAVVLSLALGQRAPFSSLINGNCVRLLRLAFGTVRDDFFGRLHVAFHSADSVYNNQHKHIKIIIQPLKQNLECVSEIQNSQIAVKKRRNHSKLIKDFRKNRT